ncbi:hypothetical protein LTR93_011995 [Exophiala xenobiotica]|nr:hypothetical protein LTR93_011995 [Exophiala xenobiotica]
MRLDATIEELTRTTGNDARSEDEEELLNETEFEAAGRLLKLGATFAVTRTPCWTQEQSQHPTPRTMRAETCKLNTGKEPETENRNIILCKCYACEEMPPHFHQKGHEDPLQFPFKDDSILEGEELTKERPSNTKLKKFIDHAVIVKTHFWEKDEWQWRTVGKFSPKANIQPDFKRTGLP